MKKDFNIGNWISYSFANSDSYQIEAYRDGGKIGSVVLEEIVPGEFSVSFRDGSTEQKVGHIKGKKAAKNYAVKLLRGIFEK